MRGLDIARRATVRVCDREGNHRGQGLLLDLDDEGTIILTCHHVIAELSAQDLCIAIPQPNGQLGKPIQVRYDEQRSHPGMDAVVLRTDAVRMPERPLLHALNPITYAGTLPGRATGITHFKVDTFDARVASGTRLDIPAERPGSWPDAPARYALPFVYRLADPSDARPGISGSVVVYEDGVLGLAHFSRAAGADYEREVYLVPLSVWSEGWPGLAKFIGPLIDRNLRTAATVKRASELEIATDLAIALRGYRADIYIDRAQEALAHKALEKHGGVIIIGKPMSGKTRLAWQLMQKLPESLVVIPHQDRPPSSFESSSLVGNDIILFFDDLHRTALSSDPPEWKRQLEGAAGLRPLLICTTRDGDDWKGVKERPRVAQLLDMFGTDACVFTSNVSEEGNEKGQDLSEAEGWVLAQALDIEKEEFERRFDGTPGSLTLDLRDMHRRYERLRDEVRGDVSMSRLLDSAKLLHTASQPRFGRLVLKAVAEEIRGQGRISTETWEMVQRRTQEEGFGQFDNSDDIFQTYRPYLEQCVSYKPSTEEIDALLPILSKAEDYTGLLYLAETLIDEDHLPLAERACKTAIDGGDSLAYNTLGRVLAMQAGREAEAEQAYREAVDAGDVAAYNNLGLLFSHQPGREAEAEQAFRDAIKAGTKIAALNLGTLLQYQPGREAEAEQVLRDGIRDTGIKLLNAALGDLLANQPGREVEAEHAYWDALSAGYGSAFLRIGRLLANQPGREAEAEQVFRDAINVANDEETQDVQMYVDLLDLDEIYHNLGLLLARQPGRHADAEQAFRNAIEVGLTDAYVQLALLLARQPGRETEAEQVLRNAIDAGVIAASAQLGFLLIDQPERKVEAEELFRDGIKAGDKMASLGLGGLLTDQPGREAEAEQALRDFISTGENRGYHNLGILLADKPDRQEEAEQAFRIAIDAGSEGAYLHLGSLLATQPGREAEAEQMYQHAIDAGITDAEYGLGVLLANQPGRKTEGCEALRRAQDAGIEEAAEALEQLCKESG